MFAHVGDRLRDFDAATFAATAGVDLRLDDPNFSAERVRRFLGFCDGEARHAARCRNTILAQQLLALIFVNVHWSPSIMRFGCSTEGVLIPLREARGIP